MASIRKRTWTTKSGKPGEGFVVDYRSADGKRHLKTFRRKTDAQTWLAEHHSAIDRGQFGSVTGAITVKEACDQWLAACERGRNGGSPCEAHTLRSYRNHANNWIIPQLGDKRLGELTPPEVRKYRDWLMDKCPSRSTARAVFKSFKSIILEAISAGYLAANPATGIGIKTANRERKQLVMPSRNEVARCLATVDTLAVQENKQWAKAWRRYRPLMYTAVMTGMRSSELRGLSWDTVELAAGTIEVVQRADETGVIGQCKSAAAYRKIQIPECLIKLLRVWKVECPHSCHRLVFPNWQGNVECRANIWGRCWQPLQQAAKVVTPEGRGKYNIHTLRHFHASVLIQDGATPREVMEEMGHAGISITFDTYGHLFQEDDGQRKDRANRIAASLSTGLTQG